MRHHPWVFSGATIQPPQSIDAGEVVRVEDYKGRFMCIAHYEPSTIALRVLSWEEEEVNKEFWHKRIVAAYALRERIGLGLLDDTDTYRLLHGEGDGVPALVVDRYGDVAVVQAHSTGIHLARKAIAEAVCHVCGEQIKHVYYKSDGSLPHASRDESEDEWLIGHASELKVVENGVRFHIDLERGQKTGFFLDQRDNRHLLEKYSKGKSVLNMFCYTGGFSCYALRGGAEKVVSVDSSERAIEMTKKNVQENFPDGHIHVAVCEDAFRYLNKDAEKFDIVVLDPPAFAKHRKSLHNAIGGYTRLNAAGLRHVKRGGLLFTFSCSQAITKQHFQGILLNAALQAGREVRIIRWLHQGEDHPVSACHPEGEYLKGLIAYVE